MQKQIIERLRYECGGLISTIRDLGYCVDEHAEEYVAGQLHILGETLDQLQLLDGEVRKMFHALEAHVT